MPLASNLSTVGCFAILACAILGSWPAVLAVAVATFVWEAAMAFAAESA